MAMEYPHRTYGGLCCGQSAALALKAEERQILPCVFEYRGI